MADENRVILYASWSSSCSWRVRAMLQAKQLEFEDRPVDTRSLRTQLTDQYRAINPAQKVPALIIDGEIIVESMAILQYLEETRPSPSLTPNTPLLRARMREICETVVSGIQPLQNFGLKPHFETEEKFQRFTKYWSERGLQTLEDLLVKSSGRYCVGDKLTMADICLVPQLFNAVSRYQLDLSKHPTLSRIYEHLLTEDIFDKTHPKNIKPRK